MAQRLDTFLVAKGYYATRSRALDAIKRGTIFVDDKIAQKPSAKVLPGQSIKIRDAASHYVSRAALKLLAGLDSFGFDCTGRTALDIGSSTGGFTQVLLEHNAKHVFAIDVGEGQLAQELQNNPHITLMEKTNARALNTGADGSFAAHKIDAIVSDVSFISLKLALPPALELARSGAWGIFLVKPQFEVGKDNIGKGGVVKNPGLAEHTATGIADWLDDQSGWVVKNLIPSPIKGSDGNGEFLLGAVKR